MLPFDDDAITQALAETISATAKVAKALSARSAYSRHASHVEKTEFATRIRKSEITSAEKTGFAARFDYSVSIITKEIPGDSPVHGFVALQTPLSPTFILKKQHSCRKPRFSISRTTRHPPSTCNQASKRDSVINKTVRPTDQEKPLSAGHGKPICNALRAACTPGRNA